MPSGTNGPEVVKDRFTTGSACPSVEETAEEKLSEYREPVPSPEVGTMVTMLPVTVIVRGIDTLSYSLISVMALFTLAGVTAALKMAIIVGLGGTLVGETEPFRSMSPAVIEVTLNAAVSEFFLQEVMPEIKVITSSNELIKIICFFIC